MYTNIGLLRTSRAARLAAEAEYLHDPNPDKKRNEAAPELELVCVNHVMHPHEMHPPCTVHCVFNYTMLFHEGYVFTRLPSPFSLLPSLFALRSSLSYRYVSREAYLDEIMEAASATVRSRRRQVLMCCNPPLGAIALGSNGVVTLWSYSYSH